MGLPIEVVNSLDLLARARQDFIAAIVEYDQAQFRLFVALGNPPAVAFPTPRLGRQPQSPTIGHGRRRGLVFGGHPKKWANALPLSGWKISGSSPLSGD